jgi:hypothetical protein
MIGFGLIWFIWSRVEFQVEEYMRKRSVQKNRVSHDDNDMGDFEEGGMR